MIAIDRLKKVRKIVTHANCPDGLASALILHDALPNAEVMFLDHGSKAHRELAVEEAVLFCDFTPHHEFEVGRNCLDGWKESGVIVLDHHVTHKWIVEALGGIYAEDRSGALLAYEEVWRPLKGEGHESCPMCGKWKEGAPTKDLQMEQFARRAAVRDLWQTNSQDWKKACEQAASLMFWGWERLRYFRDFLDEEEILNVGARDLERRDEDVRRAIANGYRTTAAGKKAIIFEGTHVTSDAADILGDTVDLVVGFAFVVEGNIPRIVFSTRSHTGFDCAALAKSHGGGGHKPAAGFKWYADDPYAGFMKAFRSFMEMK